MQKRIQQAFTSLREHTCVNYAKIVTIGGFCDINLIIIKATSPDDFVVPKKYVLDLLKIFSITSSSYQSFAISFTRRFGKTKSWRVALKCLILLHRLLRSLPDDRPFRAELLWIQNNGLLSLYPCNFRDYSSSASEDYTTFVKSYARLIHEILDSIHVEIFQNQQIIYLDKINCLSKIYDEDFSPKKIEDYGKMIETLPHLQNLIDRVIDCWPMGAPMHNSLVQSSLELIIRDSFTLYTSSTKNICMVLDNMVHLPSQDCVAAFTVYKKASIQADQLSQFHDWCKSVGCCESYEYPFIDRIPDIQVHALENFLNGMQQFIEQSSSSNMSTLASDVQSPLSLIDEENDYSVPTLDTKVYLKLETTGPYCDTDEEPLIKWEDDNTSGLGWEDLLEASIRATSYVDSRNSWSNGNYLDEANGWQIQECNAYAIQTHQNFNYGLYACPSTPMPSLIDL